MESKETFGISGIGREENKDEDIWILYQPQNYKTAGIRVSIWVESLREPEGAAGGEEEGNAGDVVEGGQKE